MPAKKKKPVVAWAVETQYIDTRRWKVERRFTSEATAEMYVDMHAWTVPVRITRIVPAPAKAKGKR